MLANKHLTNDQNVIAKRGKIVAIGNRGFVEVNVRDAISEDGTIFQSFCLMVMARVGECEIDALNRL